MAVSKQLLTESIQNDHLRLEYLASAGPRITGLFYRGGKNLLAEVHELYEDTPQGRFWFRGGHRLWRSPEVMPDTYTPDNEGLETQKIANGVILRQQVDGGISKQIEIRLEPERAVCALKHRLINSSAASARLAVWALTMFKPGGIGIFPQPVGPADPAGFLPNRRLALWPYTRMRDERFVWGDEAVLIKAQPKQPPIKFGYFNDAGWTGYVQDGILFVKRFQAKGEGEYPDFGCNCEMYCNDRFIELETLSPLATLQPGEALEHDEEWEVHPLSDDDALTERCRQLINHL